MRETTEAEREVVRIGLDQHSTAELEALANEAGKHPESYALRFEVGTTPAEASPWLVMGGEARSVFAAAHALGREGVLSVVREILAERGDA